MTEYMWGFATGFGCGAFMVLLPIAWVKWISGRKW